jgi:tetratricopeptide (TPR) repeat protein
MRRVSPFNRNAILLSFVLSLVLPVSLFGKKDETPGDQAEAEKWITDTAKPLYRIDELNSQYLLYSSRDKTVHYGIALAHVTSIDVGLGENRYPTIKWQDITRDKPESMMFVTMGRAERFAASLRYLVSNARIDVQNQRETALQQFSAQAKAWRESSPKPVMPEAAREHQVLAEYAFKQRETDKAIREYLAAVTEFPTWAEGHFNLATLAGEQRDYDTAFLHMSEYLELVPDSADAQAAKDSIIIWKDRLNSAFGSSVKLAEGQGQKKGVLHNVSQTSK